MKQKTLLKNLKRFEKMLKILKKNILFKKSKTIFFFEEKLLFLEYSPITFSTKI